MNPETLAIQLERDSSKLKKGTKGPFLAPAKSNPVKNSPPRILPPEIAMLSELEQRVSQEVNSRISSKELFMQGNERRHVLASHSSDTNTTRIPSLEQISDEISRTTLVISSI